MNEFLYKAAKEQLLAMKTSKELDTAVRKYSSLRYQNVSNVCTQAEYEDLKFNYKLFALAKKLFSAKSKQKLPDFINTYYVTYQKRLTDKILGLKADELMPQAASYEEFMDLFEFDTNVALSQRQEYCYIPSLHNIILDKPIHFTISWNDNLSNFEIYSTTMKREESYYIKAIRYKQTISPDKPSTILDYYLETRRRGIKAQLPADLKLVRESITKLIQHITACQQFAEEFTNEQL